MATKQAPILQRARNKDLVMANALNWQSYPTSKSCTILADSAKFNKMINSENLSKRQAAPLTRNLIVVSGYYGFDNLGDEAILEELLNELRRLCAPEEIVVLSGNAQRTTKAYATPAVNRWQLSCFLRTMRRTKLFISGGGSLFQDTRNLNSIIFYGGQIVMARLSGAKVMIYAQGIGPLKRPASRFLTKCVWRLAQSITVRDEPSKKLLENWGISATLTADPVWCLPQSLLPSAVVQQLPDNGLSVSENQTQSALLIGISLRPSSQFPEKAEQTLAEVLKETLPPKSRLLLLPLQMDNDKPILQSFANACKSIGLDSELFDTSLLTQPSQWLSLIARVDFLIGMRLHALLIALKSGKPVAGIPYDPKVSHLLELFGQPTLKLEEHEKLKESWTATLSEAFANLPGYALKAQRLSRIMEEEACKNFPIVAKILQS
jgi:polysaccharide pyruvyl transferase CsaB